MNNKLNIYLPSEVKVKIAEGAKQLRLQKGLKRTTLTERSGVPTPTIKRFETTGDISLSSLLKIANALGSLDDFLKLFPRIEPMTLKEVEQRENKSVPKRGTI
jgi:transcriptional regulator with XRE-family HTH domain